jgi:hypothetical protein
VGDLGQQLGDRDRLAELRENVVRQRSRFTFDHHADALVEFFEAVISSRRL